MDKPDVIYYHKNGNVMSETWYKDNMQHRDDDDDEKPAFIEYEEI